MQALDASSIIYAWDNYPLRQFPRLWQWMADQIELGTLVIPAVALEEVGHKAPDCSDWLKETGVQKLEISGEILQGSLRIKAILGITDDNYHAKGVDENDILIIATARAHGAELISDERQPNRPVELRRLKIPRVCNLTGVDVAVVTFVDFFKRSDQVFG